jgi:hypothetical protein
LLACPKYQACSRWGISNERISIVHAVLSLVAKQFFPPLDALTHLVTAAGAVIGGS